MDDMVGKLVAALFVMLVIVFDWPRAVAGLLAGIAIRWSKVGYPVVTLAFAVVAIAGLGELIYAVIGRTAGASWNSFGLGLVSAGAAAYGLFRWFYDMVQS